MITEPIIVRQLCVSNDHIYAIDDNGAVWFRKRLPAPAYASAAPTVRKKAEEEEEEEAKKMWKRLSMMARIAGDDIPPSKDIPVEITGISVNPKPEASPEPFTGQLVDEADELDIGYFSSSIRCFEE